MTVLHAEARAAARAEWAPACQACFWFQAALCSRSLGAGPVLSSLSAPGPGRGLRWRGRGHGPARLLCGSLHSSGARGHSRA